MYFKYIFIAILVLVALTVFNKTSMCQKVGKTPVESSQVINDSIAMKNNQQDTKTDKDNLMVNYSNVISALLGAFFTFLATQYTERKNRIKKRNERIREMRFEKIANTSHVLNKAVQTCIEFQKDTSSKENDLLGDEALREAELKKIIIDAKAHFESSLLDIQNAVVDLKLVQVDGGLLNIVEKAICISSDIMHNINKWGTIQNSEILDQVYAKQTELTNLTNTFIDNALDSYRD